MQNALGYTARATLPGRPTLARKPNRAEKPFWSETILSKGPTGYSRPQTQPRDNREIGIEERGRSDENHNEIEASQPSVAVDPCAGLVATFLGGCAEGPYVAAYGTGYYPTGYYRTLLVRLLRLSIFVLLRADL
jgi:hypothetical protein